MSESRLGITLKAARSRVGWSREALAHRSGVSWSAISQIESGRRQDVRLSSLLALADALAVSVDYLIGTEAAASVPKLFRHRVLTYASDEEFVDSTAPFLLEGVGASESVLVVTTPDKTSLLRGVLGESSVGIEFADWAHWYDSPAHALRRYEDFLRQQVKAGAVWIRVVAEAAWAPGTDAEIAAWARYESLVNAMFMSSPVTIICTYDERLFPRAAIAQAHNTHPEIVSGQTATASTTYHRPEEFLLWAGAGGQDDP